MDPGDCMCDASVMSKRRGTLPSQLSTNLRNRSPALRTGRGGQVGGFHSCAMMESNSARRSDSSAHIISMNSRYTVLRSDAATMAVGAATSGVDCLLLRVAIMLDYRVTVILEVDGDPARLRLFGDWNPQTENTALVGCLNTFGIKVLPHDELSAEDTSRPFGSHELFGPLWNGPVGSNREHVPFDIEVDGAWVYTGQVEFDDKRVIFAPRIHRHDCRAGRCSEDLLCEPVKFPERFGTHQHD
jgi:hypothetical protein